MSDGQWVYEAPRKVIHKCDPPSTFDARTTRGSIWLCNCGKRWQVVKATGDINCWKRQRAPLWFKKRPGNEK